MINSELFPLAIVSVRGVGHAAVSYIVVIELISPAIPSVYKAMPQGGSQ